MAQSMKIIIIAPKYSSHNPKRLDYAFWNFYLPLIKLGHSVLFFDTCKFGNKELRQKINELKPDLLFCIMTGDKNVCPDEPWDTISTETSKGNLNTFNWFCDDSYRFDTFSKVVCSNFRWCSTPEKKYLNKYLNIGYSNIVYATWHANSDLYHCDNSVKTFDISFVGGLHGDRLDYLNYLHVNSKQILVPNAKISFEDMLYIYSASKICLNFTKDASKQQTQMKARIFEIIAAGSLLLTEYTSDLDNCFDKNSLLTFSNKEDLLSKINWINDNQNYCEKLKKESYTNFLINHESCVRLEKLLKAIS